MTTEKLTRRRFLGMVALGAGTAALAACAPKEALPTATPMPTRVGAAPTPTTAPTPTPLPASTEQLEIIWWDGNAFEEYMGFFDEMLQGYTAENPDVVVRPSHAKNFDSFVTATAGGAAPDIYFMWDGCEPLGSWITQGLVVSLDESMAATGYDVNDMIPGAIESVRYQGKIYGLPELADVYMLKRNLRAYEEKSLATDPEQTIEAWYANGEALMQYADDGSISRLGFTLPDWNWPLWQYIWLYGGSLWNEEAMEFTPDHPGVKLAVEQLVAFNAKYGNENLQRFFASQGQGFSAEDPFIVGNIATMIDADWMFDVQMRYAADLKFGEDWDAVPIPAPADVPEGKDAVHVSPYPLTLSSASKHPEEAFKVMAWMQDLERTIKAGAYMSNVPQTKSALEEALKRKVGAPGWEIAVQRALATDNQHAFPVTPISAEFSDRFVQEVGLIRTGKSDFDTAMAALKVELMDSLQKALEHA